MKIVGRLSIAAVILFSLVDFAASQGYKYEPHGKRDPFVPLIGQDKVSVIRFEDIISIEDVRLEGIAVGGVGQRSAIINGQILKENDRMGDIEIKKITENSVTLLMNENEYNLTLPEEGGESK